MRYWFWAGCRFWLNDRSSLGNKTCVWHTLSQRSKENKRQTSRGNKQRPIILWSRTTSSRIHSVKSPVGLGSGGSPCRGRDPGGAAIWTLFLSNIVPQIYGWARKAFRLAVLLVCVCVCVVVKGGGLVCRWCLVGTCLITWLFVSRDGMTSPTESLRREIRGNTEDWSP